ncbi:hypothetical protein RKD28_004165 [Streptomyces sp. SAI-229]
MVAPHHVQAQVDPGRDARRGQDVPVVDEQHVRIDLDPREQPLEALGVGPVGGGGPAVEIPGGGEDVHAGADGGEPGAGTDTGEGGGQLVGQLAPLEHRAELVGRRDDHRVGGGEGLGAVGDVEGEVGVGLHRPGRPDRAGDHLVQVPPPPVLRAAEDAVWDAQLEGEQSVEGEDHDPVGPEVGGHSGEFDRIHGPILANAVLRATRCGGTDPGSSRA